MVFVSLSMKVKEIQTLKKQYYENHIYNIISSNRLGI